MREFAAAAVCASVLLGQAPGVFAAPKEAPLTAVTDRRDVAVTVRVVGRLEAMRSTVVSSEVWGDRVMAEARGETRGAEKYFQVLVALSGEDSRLRPGMTARVEIRFAEVRGALAVPMQAVFREGGVAVCYVRRGGGFERRVVTTGLTDERWAAVTAGIAPGDEVALTLSERAAATR